MHRDWDDEALRRVRRADNRHGRRRGDHPGGGRDGVVNHGPGAEGPRIAPGTPAEIGPLNTLITRAIGTATGGPPPNVFPTLARHRRLFRRWLRFAGALMPGGLLPRVDTELLILRVAHNTGSDYEWGHHEHL